MVEVANQGWRCRQQRIELAPVGEKRDRVFLQSVLELDIEAFPQVQAHVCQLLGDHLGEVGCVLNLHESDRNSAKLRVRIDKMHLHNTSVSILEQEANK